jgi:glycosyltransferase involved in cell wall biosynthesis
MADAQDSTGGRRLDPAKETCVKPLPETPLVSVVTPSYNTGAFIEQTLRSVLDQDYPRIEHIVLDSGSTDNTPEVLARFPSLRLIRPAPQGLTEKVNYGFSIVQGDIVGYLCADDYYLPGAIAKAVEALKRNPDVAFVYSNNLCVDVHGVELSRTRGRQTNFQTLLGDLANIPQQTVFIRREALDLVGPIDTRYPLVGDLDLFLRLSKHFPILHADDWWGAFRLHPGQLSSAYRYEWWRQARKMSREHGAPFFSRLFWHFWGGKFARAAGMLLQGRFRVFTSKLRDFVVGHGLGRHRTTLRRRMPSSDPNSVGPRAH